MSGSFNDPHRIVPRRCRFRVAGSRSLYCLLNINQAIAAFLRRVLPDPQQHGEAQPPERAALLHPISSIEYLYTRALPARARRCDESADLLGREDPFDFGPFFRAQRPKSLAKRDRRPDIRMRPRARFSQVRPTACRMTARIQLGRWLRKSGSSSARASSYPSVISSSMWAVVTPGKSEPRAAVASDKPRRMRLCAGLPMTVWSRSRISKLIRPCLSAIGPRLPRWQSPQI
jgi:hypothetical protein